MVFDINGLATKFRAVVLYRRPHRTLVPAGLTLCVFGLFLWCPPSSTRTEAATAGWRRGVPWSGLARRSGCRVRRAAVAPWSGSGRGRGGRLPGQAGGIAQLPVDVAAWRGNRAGVAAAHGHDESALQGDSSVRRFGSARCRCRCRPPPWPRRGGIEGRRPGRAGGTGHHPIAGLAGQQPARSGSARRCGRTGRTPRDARFGFALDLGRRLAGVDGQVGVGVVGDAEGIVGHDGLRGRRTGSGTGRHDRSGGLGDGVGGRIPANRARTSASPAAPPMN